MQSWPHVSISVFRPVPLIGVALAATLLCLATMMGTAIRFGPDAGRVGELLGSLPLRFEPNQGQTASEIDFLARGSGYTLFLSSGEAVFSLPSPENGNVSETGDSGRALMRMEIAGAVPSEAVGDGRLPGTSNYFIGDDPAEWLTDVPQYARVRYENVYPGIDMVYYGNPGNLEFDFVVRPGADPSVVSLAFSGVDGVSLDREGNLVLESTGRQVMLNAPVAYQVVEGVRVEVPSRYVFHDVFTVGISVGAYDSESPLIIDPTVDYSTYLGGNGEDFGNAVAVDSTGQAHIVGATDSSTFPPSSSFTAGGGQDAYVAVLNAAGTALVHASYVGGSGTEEGTGIALDGSGAIYITGDTTSSNFPTTASPYQSTLKGTSDAFVTKLSSSGSSMVYSTFLGGTDDEDAEDIGVDTSGQAHVTGATQSSDYPTSSAIQSTYGGGTSDAFITKLNAAGSSLVYSTFLGGNGGDVGHGIAVDASGLTYVTGTTLPDGGGSGLDAFVVKFNTSASSLQFGTYIGGNGEDKARGVAIDSSKDIYVTGHTKSGNFPTTTGTHDTTCGSDSLCNGGIFDAFVVKLGVPDLTLPLPGVAAWGLIATALLLGAALVWQLRRRQAGVSSREG